MSARAADGGSLSMPRRWRLPGPVRRRMLLTPDLMDFSVRGFRTGDPATRQHLEAICASVLLGYNAVVREDIPEPVDELDAIEPEFRGWGYEGAGMACAVLDVLTQSGGRRIRALLTGSGEQFRYTIQVGVGMALAQLRLPGWGRLSGLDPVLRWLAWDGRGFWQGFFQPTRHLRPARVAARSRSVPGRVRDQGLGRSLWFVECADVVAIADRIDGFHPSRRADLWAGVGLAAAYAGGADAAGLLTLTQRAAGHRGELAQGAAFAAVARCHSGIVPERTVLATRALAGAEPDVAAGWGTAAIAQVSAAGHDEISAYERVRGLTRAAWLAFAGEGR
jgi:hypothetical protein